MSIFCSCDNTALGVVGKKCIIFIPQSKKKKDVKAHLTKFSKKNSLCFDIIDTSCTPFGF